MKDQYFGDFGDYQKFSLLKSLRDAGGFRIVVHWMKTRDDGGSDGRRITYLNNSAAWGVYDAAIFNFLKEHSDGERGILRQTYSAFKQSTPSTFFLLKRSMRQGSAKVWRVIRVYGSI